LGLLASTCAAPAHAQDVAAVVQDGINGALRETSCRALEGGLVGTPEGDLARRLPDEGNGLRPGDRTTAPADLPATVPLRTTQTTYNRRYWFVLRGGHIYYRSNAEVTGIRQPWAELPTPTCFLGQVVGISADDDELLAVDQDRRVYVMDGALGPPLLFSWSKRWGPPFWTGPGRTLPVTTSWSWSVVSQIEDHNWTDPAGNRFAIGFGKVSHIWLLGDGGRRLTYLDPWLPDDESYEMCGPKRGRFRAVAISSSGSTHFIVNRWGDLYTRLFDFDLSGPDGLFFSYSYEDQRGKANPKIQLPPAQWVHHPKIPGPITSAISIEKVGPNTIHRTLRVEGLDRGGRTGYWEKDITELSASAWHFHRTGLPLQGRPLANPAGDTSSRGLAPYEGGTYVSSAADGTTATLRRFNATCSPTPLVVTLPGGRTVTLLLHTIDFIRQTPRARGFDEHPRYVAGTIEAPAALLSDADPAVRAFVSRYLRGRFTPAPIQARTSALDFTQQGWHFAAASPG
jgi:hypothetical protein